MGPAMGGPLTIPVLFAFWARQLRTLNRLDGGINRADVRV